MSSRLVKMSEIINLENVTIGFNKVPMIGGINLSISDNEFWGVVGPNGGGKSTLLKTLIGLKDVVKGTYTVKEGTVFGYVPQHEKFDDIYPVSVYEIVGMGRYSKVPFGVKMNPSDWEIVDSSIEKVGVSSLKDSNFRSLSGGEKQRTLIAKAITSEPDVLVLDEPTASLDVKGESEIMSLIKDVKDEYGLTVIMVSHFSDTIEKYTDKIVLIDKDNDIFLSCTKEEAICHTYLKRYFGMETVTV